MDYNVPFARLPKLFKLFESKFSTKIRSWRANETAAKLKHFVLNIFTKFYSCVPHSLALVLMGVSDRKKKA